MGDSKKLKQPEWLHGVGVWLTVYRNTTIFTAVLTLFSSAVLVWIAAQYIDIAATLKAHPALWLAAAAVLILGLGIGIWVGITIHRSFANKRNAPLGYRIEKVEHEYWFDETDPRQQRRQRRDHITAKRDAVNLIIGRFSPSMTSVPVPTAIGSDLSVVPIGMSRYPRDWHYFVAHWTPALRRGDSKVVTVELPVFDVDWTAESQYRTRISDYVGELSIRMNIPSRLVKDGQFNCYATRSDDGDHQGREDLPHQYDASTGVLTLHEKHPRRGWLYVVKWEWTNYQPPSPALS